MNKEIAFLGEEDFLSAMQGENKTWRDTYVEAGTLTVRGGLKLRYYHAKHPHPEGCIVFLHGFCEFWGKYHEYIWYLWQAGFTVYFLEQRGHGYSEGKLPQKDIVYIDSYHTYVEDVHEFLDRVVVPQTKDLPRFLIAHSMGGAVSSLFLEKYEGYFAGAILSSPMLRLKLGNMTPLQIRGAKLVTWLFHLQKKKAPGQPHFDPTPIFERSSALSRARYDYMFRQRIEDPHYQTYGASLGWGMAGENADRELLRNAGKIRIPVTLMRAGQDALVLPEGFDAFCRRAPQTRVIVYEDSRHEIFNALDETRIRYFRDVLDTLEGYLKNEKDAK